MKMNEWRRRSYDIDLRATATTAQSLLPGLALCVISVMAAIYVTEHYGGPSLLIALLMGMAFNNLTQNPDYQPGLDFCASSLLRIGVALLGTRMMFSDMSLLGHTPFTLTFLSMAGTFLGSYCIGKLLKLDMICILISGAAVAICGISAAIAIAAVLPLRKEHEQHLLCTIAGIAGVSTLAMVFYPAFTQQIMMSDLASGLFIGTTIHDVAQVAGAGYLLSEEVGDLAVYTKMIRVAALLPIVMLLSYLYRDENADQNRQGRFSPPGFLIGFIVLAALSNLGLLPPFLLELIKDSSRFFLLIAIVALGARTNLAELGAVGWRPFGLLLGNSLVVALVSLLFLACFVMQ